MKPVNLTLSAFGPFPQTVSIDLLTLSRSGLFLVHGPTGAGKSTLLDGLCFALYGVSAGGERTARDLRCHQAAPGTKTQVTFVFEVDGTRYRVTRRPEQVRGKKDSPEAEATSPSGDETSTKRKRKATVDKSAASLAVREARGDQPLLDLGLDAFTEIASKPTDVNTHIQALLGLTADQFRQVVVLPQGRFREFLLASSRDRQAILESLFQAERYKRLEELMRQRRATLQETLREEQQRRAVILEQSGASDVATLEQVVRRAQGELDALATRVEMGEATLVTLRQRLVTAQETARLLREKQRVDGELAPLLARSETMSAMQRTLDQALRALTLRNVIERIDALRALQKDARAGLEVARDALQHADKRAAEAEKVLHVVEKGQSQRERWEVELATVVKKRNAFREVDTAKRGFEIATEAYAEANAARVKAVQTVQHHQTKVQHHQSRLTEVQQVAARFETKRSRYVTLLDARKHAGRRADLQASIGTRTAAHAQLQADVQKAGATLAEEVALLDRAEDAWLGEQAAVLAQTLVDGAPCPVCGSPEHPGTPNDSQNVTAISQRALQNRRKSLRESEAALKTLTDAQHKIDVQLEGDRRELASTQKSLAPGTDLTPESLQEQLRIAEAEMEAAEAAHDEKERLQGVLAAAQVDLTDLNDDVHKAEAAERESVTRREQARAAYDQLRAGLHDDQDALREKEATLRRALEESRAAEEKARRVSAEAQTEQAHRKGQVLSLEEQTAKAAVDITLAESSLKAGLQTHGFDDDHALRAAVKTDDQIETLRNELNTYQQTCRSLQERQREVQAALEDRDVLDVTTLERELTATEKAHLEAVQMRGEKEARLSQLRLWTADFAEAEAREATVHARFETLGTLAEVALGDNPHKMTFQRFVLATLLDDVLENASARLLLMSRGRYTLRRQVAPLRGRRRAQGLELVVDDRQTGTERSVHTLSGGESFLAALALALGLSDAVESRAQGRPLDAIFVDEGFGGLDPESLDTALDALDALRQSGRAVGIISHVTELRERIQTRLEVVRTPRGSRVAISA